MSKFFIRPAHRRDGDRDHHGHCRSRRLVELPTAQFPEIAPPQIVVQATYPGADAQTLMQSVTTPLEQQISGVDKMQYMYVEQREQWCCADHGRTLMWQPIRTSIRC